MARELLSESFALRKVRRLLVEGRVEEAVELVDVLLDQVERRGVHANPGLTIFGNPGGRKMSDDVLAVLYRHTADGEYYCHGFGNADIRLDGDPDRGVSIEGLKTRTGVTMVANADGSITLRHGRNKLWGHF